MNKTLLLIGAAVLLTTSFMMMSTSSSSTPSKPTNNISENWATWKSYHSKSYGAEEETYRFEIFRANLKKIEEHNARGDSYKMAINQFADMSQEEFVAVVLSNMDPAKLAKKPSTSTIPELMAANELKQSNTVDWVSKGVTGPVLDQGRCGSCWAFSAVETIQSAIAISTGSFPPLLSEEQLVQCSFSYGNEGCNGGWPISGMEYVHQYPLATESQYPYSSYNGATGRCNADFQNQGTYRISSYADVPYSCSSLQNALNAQPVSVCVDATNWQFYSSGILSNCGKNINHAVLLVGSTTDYWNVQNSWATSWGEGGYIKLAPGDTCGVCGYGAVASA